MGYCCRIFTPVQPVYPTASVKDFVSGALRRAWVAAATMIGALTISRIVMDSELSAAILREAKKRLVNLR
jgi:hypothetical protein